MMMPPGGMMPSQPGGSYMAPPSYPGSRSVPGSRSYPAPGYPTQGYPSPYSAPPGYMNPSDSHRNMQRMSTPYGQPGSLQRTYRSPFPGDARSEGNPSPAQLQKNFKSGNQKLKDAIHKKDEGAVREQLNHIRHESDTLKQRLHGLPLEQRLAVPSLSVIYDEGARLVEEGVQSGDQKKTQMGMNKLEQATRHLGELDRKKR